MGVPAPLSELPRGGRSVWLWLRPTVSHCSSCHPQALQTPRSFSNKPSLCVLIVSPEAVRTSRFCPSFLTFHFAPASMSQRDLFLVSPLPLWYTMLRCICYHSCLVWVGGWFWLSCSSINLWMAAVFALSGRAQHPCLCPTHSSRTLPCV